MKCVSSELLRACLFQDLSTCYSGVGLGSRTGSRVPLRSPEEQRGAQLVSLRRGAGQQAVLDGAGEGCQGQQQVKQGLLKSNSVSEL